jgi:hypothetical protein
MQLPSYITTVYYLLLTEYYIAKQTITDKFIDLCIWIFTVAPIMIYLYPLFGMDTAFGAFMIAGMSASAGTLLNSGQVQHD